MSSDEILIEVVKSHQFIINHAHPPSNATKISAVKIPAPALSAPVADLLFNPLVPKLPLPAFGSPLLVPPVELVTGGPTLPICVDMMTSRAAICCPTPLLPSQTAPLDHFSPQARPLSPPEHCNAAAVAEVSRAFIIWPVVKGATFVVCAIQRERYALKLNMSVSQLTGVLSSQATSTMIPVLGSVKTVSAASRSPDRKSVV